LSVFDGQKPAGTWKLILNSEYQALGWIKDYDVAVTMQGAKKVKPSKPKLKFTRSGAKIKAAGRVTLGGNAPTAAECGGRVTSEFQRKSTRRKNGKRVTVYTTVSESKSALTFLRGKCGFNVATKLPSSARGKKLRVQFTYLGGDYIAPFKKGSTVTIGG
jgi:hypothetical protein